MKASELVAHLKKKKNERNLRGMEKFGINVSNAVGMPIPDLRQLARKSGPTRSFHWSCGRTGSTRPGCWLRS